MTKLHEIVAEHNNPPTLFELPDNSLGKIYAKDGKWTYQSYNEAALNAHLCQWVSYVATTSKGGEIKPELSRSLVQAYIGGGDWKGVPAVRRMAPAPVIGADLSVGWDEGYFAPAKTYITSSMEQPSWVNEDLDSEDALARSLAANRLNLQAKKSAQELAAWFKSFAFEDRRSTADCIAMAITPLILSYIPEAVIPGAIFTANKEGSGKTTCAQLISIMATGDATAPTTWPSEGQMRTQITTTLKRGGVYSLFDNVKTNMDNDGLEALLTSRTWQDRKFHTQDSLDLPNDTVWLFTKNSPEISPDLLRRLVLVSMDKFQQTESTWDPTILHRAKENRAEIQGHLVSILLSWKYNGARLGDETMIGFEQWSQVISGIFDTVGITGFLESRAGNITNIHTEDEELADIVTRIYNVMGDQIWSSGELVDKCNVDWRDEVDMEPEVKKDLQFLNLWLRHATKGTNPAMTAGRKLAPLNGRQMTGTPLVLRKLPGAKARYQIEPRDKDGKIDYREQLQLASLA